LGIVLALKLKETKMSDAYSYSDSQCAWRYRQIHEAVEKMGGWANFSHWLNTHSVNYFATCRQQDVKLKLSMEMIGRLEVALKWKNPNMHDDVLKFLNEWRQFMETK
jgi:hypothetical protein